MRILVRNFNDSINSKSGSPLPPGMKRGTPEWHEFEKIMFSCLDELGHQTVVQQEHPFVGDMPGGFQRFIYCHKSKRERSNGHLFYMQMHMKWLFTIDTNGWGADHSEKPTQEDITCIDEEIARDFVRNLSDALLLSGETKCPQDTRLSETPSAPFILIPLQIPRDYTLKYHSPITLRYFLDSMENWANESQNHIAFKLHPHNKCDGDLIDMVNEAANSHYCHLVTGPIHELIKRSKGLFVINSGTGFEALIHGKPVATFGNCDYNTVTHNADIRRIDEARNFIYSYSEKQRNLAYKYIYWYINEHAYDVRQPSTKGRLKNYLCSKLAQ